MNLTQLDGGTALVTGAASGIGRASALAFAKRGANLAICDLDEEGLADTAKQARELGRDVISARVDVANRQAMQMFAEQVHAQVEAVDVLMNNAGVGLGGGFLDTTLEDWEWIVGINLKGVVHGCHFFLPRMVERARGHVVNVSSAAGYFASQALAAYCTTKFAVLGLSEALRDELWHQGVGVTTVCPGIINTGITRSSRIRGPANPAKTRERMVTAYQRRNYTPERVAANILKAIARNRAVAPISPEAWALYWLKRFTPGFTGWIARRAAAAERRRRDG